MKIAIIGGGLTGLTAARQLSLQNHEVTVFEKEKTLGGLAYGFKQPNWEWHLEYAYHHLFTNDDAIRNLCRDLDVTTIIKRPITANFTKDGIHQLDDPLKLLTYKKLTLASRLRTAALLGSIKANPIWKPYEKFTAKDIFIRFGGAEAWHHMWEPLMVGKFGPYAEKVAASWLWARIKKRTTELVYIEGGFHTLVTALEKNIIKNGGTIRTDTQVTSIQQPKSTIPQFQISYGSKKALFDRIIITTPTPLATKLLPAMTEDLKKSLTIPHLWAQTLILETKEPILKDVYWLNILDRTFPFLAAVAHTNYMDASHYGGNHLTYFGNYLPQGHKYLTMTKDQLLKVFTPFIRKINPSLNSKLYTLNSFLFTAPFAQPVHEVNYSAKAPKLTTSIPGIYIANMDSIYPWDRGTNYAVELGEEVATAINNTP